MTEFAGRTAVVTGGGSGMGRELVRQLVAEACNVAMCDVSPTGLAETQRLCEAAGLPQGLRVTPHIKCSVVMPGHIGTSIPLNTRKVQSGNQADAMDATQLAQARARFASMGRDGSTMSDDDIRQRVAERERRFREEAPTSAAEAATIILNGVKADQWRILVGPDAHKIDELVRRSFAREVGWRLPT